MCVGADRLFRESEIISKLMKGSASWSSQNSGFKESEIKYYWI